MPSLIHGSTRTLLSTLSSNITDVTTTTFTVAGLKMPPAVAQSSRHTIVTLGMTFRCRTTNKRKLEL